jgi:ankyrin repeat protein
MHNKQNNRQERKLARAVKQDNTEKIEKILTSKQAKKLANTADHGGYSLLHKASSAQAARLLLAARAASNTQTTTGLTPLHLVKTEEAAQALIAANADVLARDKHGRTPLHYARSAAIAHVILNAYAPEAKVKKLRANALDENNRTPLFMASSTEIVNELIAAGANINAQDNIGNTPLHTAQNAEVIEALLAHGAKLNAYNKESNTPFETIAQNAKKHAEALRALLKHYALITYQKKGDTTQASTLKEILNDELLTACFLGNVKKVEALLNHDHSSINKQLDGITPLNAAASQGHMDIVRMLIAHGAIADSTTSYLAVRNKMKAVALLLENHATRTRTLQQDVQQAHEQEKPQSSSSSASTSSPAIGLFLQPHVLSTLTESTIYNAPLRSGITYAAAVGCRNHQ